MSNYQNLSQPYESKAETTISDRWEQMNATQREDFIRHNLAAVSGYYYSNETNLNERERYVLLQEITRLSMAIREIEKPEYIYCACQCGTKILRFDRNGREHHFVAGHNQRLLVSMAKEARKNGQHQP